MKRRVTAVWNGTGLEGKGTLSSANNFFNQTPYSFKTRFENEDGKAGTNPEELIAAAHAGCFNMQLSFMIVAAGFTADELSTEATVSLDPVEGGFAISNITLDLHGKVSGMDEAKFIELANAAKAGCPVSKALSATPITLNVSFSA
ncbi:OsmC family protein [Pedobacter nutrimenti]|jgi:osmotically inducible protein OsmC|uniref:Osmotically inducible protein OsmC n=1 Tax=Pedobacter nutrimenti TaxID=1241337 RepID=A0A318ULE0_9SPHI|nr:OsmC family protein [Pedobacter nutrimenti]PYF69517.1 osmotically inducible protein OsmC [Pedobacter nutrimenti]|eukprot:gene13924-16425_t